VRRDQVRCRDQEDPLAEGEEEEEEEQERARHRGAREEAPGGKGAI